MGLYRIIRRYLKKIYRFIRWINCEIRQKLSRKTIMLLTTIITVVLHFYNVRSNTCRKSEDVVEYKPKRLTKSEIKRLPIIYHPRPTLEDTETKVESDYDQDKKADGKENITKEGLSSFPKKIYDAVINLFTCNYIGETKKFINRRVSGIKKISSDIKEYGFFSTMVNNLFCFGRKWFLIAKNLIFKESDEGKDKGLLETLGIKLVVTVVGECKLVEEESSNIIFKGISRLGSLIGNVLLDLGTVIKEEISEFGNLINKGVSGISNLIDKGANKPNSCFNQEQELAESNPSNPLDLVQSEGESSNIIQKGVSWFFGLINKGVNAFKSWYAGTTSIEEVNSNGSSLQEEFSNIEDGPHIIQDEQLGFRNISQGEFYTSQNPENLIGGLFSNRLLLFNVQEESVNMNMKDERNSSEESNYVSSEQQIAENCTSLSLDEQEEFVNMNLVNECNSSEESNYVSSEQQIAENCTSLSLDEQEESVNMNLVNECNLSEESNYASCEEYLIEDVCCNRYLRKELIDEEVELYYDAM